MQSIDRWRNWTPEKEEITEESPKTELTKPTKPSSVSFVSSIPEQTPIITSASGGMAENDPAAWKDDFARWMAENCIHREGREDSAGIGCLLLDFAEWCIAHEGVCCQRAVFETLLEEAGFRCADGMVAGMILKVDLETVLGSQAAPRAAEPQRRASRESLPIRELP